MIEEATKKAREMEYVQGQKRVCAIIVDRKGSILSEGFNSYHKSHPIQYYYAKKAGLPLKIFLHAEIDALNRIKQGTPYKIYIARVDYNGNPMYAKPCPICSEAIKNSSIETVEYTT